MKKRMFLQAGLGLATTSLLAPLAAQAQAALKEGTDYQLVVPPQPVEALAPKVDVLEFFWYGCPHCFDLEPDLNAWIRKQGNAIAFRRIPYPFRNETQGHSKLYYTLEALGRLDLHDKVFTTIHVDRRSLLRDNDIFDWAAQNGLDREKFIASFNSFTVIGKVNNAAITKDNYRVSGVPTLAIQGRYLTAPSIAGSKARCLQVMDALVEKVRSQKS